MNRGTAADKINFQATYGLLFFGVPNQGMDIDSLLPMVKGQENLSLLMTLRKGSELLRKLHRDFCSEFDFRDSSIISFYETERSRTAKKASYFNCKTR